LKIFDCFEPFKFENGLNRLTLPPRTVPGPHLAAPTSPILVLVSCACTSLACNRRPRDAADRSVARRSGPDPPRPPLPCGTPFTARPPNPRTTAPPSKDVGRHHIPFFPPSRAFLRPNCPTHHPPRPLYSLSGAGRRGHLAAVKLRLSSTADSTSPMSATLDFFCRPPLVNLVLQELPVDVTGHRRPPDADECRRLRPHRRVVQGVSLPSRHHVGRLPG
jgi:hypothetical protein